MLQFPSQRENLSTGGTYNYGEAEAWGLEVAGRQPFPNFSTRLGDFSACGVKNRTV